MLNSKKTAQNMFWAIFILYFSPIFVLSLYSMNESGWNVFCVGLLEASVGSCLMYILLRYWETAVPIQVVEPVEEHNPHEDELEKLRGELAEFRDISEKFAAYRVAAEDEIRKKESLFNETQSTLSRQREVLKKRQDQVNELEGKIQGLNVEVRSLMESSHDFSTTGMTLKETSGVYQITPSPSIVLTPNDANDQLKKCMDIACKITGANHFEAANSRFRDWHIDNYALDLRRLFDNLRSETASTIFVFSQKDNRLLFVNNQAKALLGWSADKFIQNFQEIVEPSIHEWNRGINTLVAQNSAETSLKMKNMSGQPVEVHCHMGMISSGLFRNHIIGVLYP